MRPFQLGHKLIHLEQKLAVAVFAFKREARDKYLLKARTQLKHFDSKCHRVVTLSIQLSKSRAALPVSGSHQQQRVSSYLLANCSGRERGGEYRARTGDLRLAKPALSQLS
jgi:hypothetical protein